MSQFAVVTTRRTARSSAARFLSLRRNSQSTDEKMRLFIGWWHRMHRRRSGLVVLRMKTMIRSEEKSSQPARFVWEVCKWPRWRGFDWVFICWMIDGVGLWLKKFSTRLEAMNFFRQPAEIVMEAKTSTPEDVSACST